MAEEVKAAAVADSTVVSNPTLEESGEERTSRLDDVRLSEDPCDEGKRDDDEPRMSVHRLSESPFFHEKPALEFNFSECSYSVKARKRNEKKKALLHGVSASVAGGQVMAILGPSGAGKTTLISMLMLDRGQGTPVGDIKLNGHRLTTKRFTSHCAVVTQVDQHWAFLTCREHLEFALSLYQPKKSAEEKVDVVSEMLKAMGLNSCQHTRAGNQFFRGLSGGQSRRLSVALALLKRPAIILLDEPTSGLDAAGASSIMSFLADVAIELKIAVVCTIHQPSAHTFAAFDKCLILSGGQTAYLGSPGVEMQDYLASINRPLPPHVNPAEHVLELVNRDFTNPHEVDDMLNKWFEKAPVTKAPAVGDLVVQPRRAGIFKQILILIRKHFWLKVRDPSLYVGRVVFFLMACSFFAVVYIEARSRVQDQVLNRLFEMMWFATAPCCLGTVTVFALHTELKSVTHETRDGMYSPGAYVVAHTLLQIPLMVLLSLSAIGIPAYGIANFYLPQIVRMVAVYSLELWAFECIAQLFSLVSNPLLGMLGFLCIWFSAFLFSGVMIPIDNVFWPIRASCYISPFYWSLRSMAYTEFYHTPHFSGAKACDETSAIDCRPTGFYCPGDLTGLQCYGRTGPQILTSIGINFESFTSDNTLMADSLALLCIALTSKLAFTVLLYHLLNNGKEPAASSKAGSDVTKRLELTGDTVRDAVEMTETDHEQHGEHDTIPSANTEATMV